MRDLDESVADWRCALLANGLQDGDLLEELESHLRDAIDDELAKGATAAEAFALAIAQIGQPEILHQEFDKLGCLSLAQQKLKQAFLILAGVPQACLNPAMNSSSNSPNIEPAWATYCKSGTFAGPAIVLWTATTIFVLPKLEQICRDAGLGSDLSFWKVTHSNFALMILFRDYGIYCLAALVAAFALLEWRSARWPRYRRAALGAGAFLLNLAVLISIFVLIITATAAAPALLQHAR
jgi:hypothetical protein